ncbi:hypothetical protein IEO21_09395 [Rhodonia placenta]|uniref:DNA helicase n=1 Tax=Rhodonia placenta TaxID=104341 RepID=A0A8H7TXX4_9APHY|nr:hypothetical protein IEO21_09395 [Postia placenta]
MTSEDEIRAFIAQHRILLAKERDAEVQRSSLLLSNCSPRLLEQKGLALLGLGVVGVNIGLGAKTLVELERPTAYHSSPLFPPHTLSRPGDLARVEEHTTDSARKKTGGAKGKKTDASDGLHRRAAEGVIYKVSDVRIVIALDASESSGDNLDLPERCRVVKLANSVTYDRMDKALDQLEKVVLSEGSNPAGDQSAPRLTPLIRVLMGMQAPSERVPMRDIKFFDDGLNSSQQDAVRFALESPEVACIHGPPGTGKTHTLIEIIRQLTSVSEHNARPLRLLICGASNLAVDNILERLLALPSRTGSEKLRATRIGHPARIMAHEGVLDATLEVKASRSDQAALAKDVKNELEAALDMLSGKGKGAKGKGPRGAERKKMWEEVRALRKEYRQREGGVVEIYDGDDDRRALQVVIATCYSAGGRQLRNHQFDVVVIDEATQAMEAVCWIPIFKAKKLILAGDPMQLPPTILAVDKKRKKKAGKTEKAKGRVNGLQKAQTPKLQKNLHVPRSLETTLFDRLEKMYGPGIKRMLNVQYRMHEQIAAFPSKAMYQNKLAAHASVASHLLRDLPNARAENDDDEKEVLGTPVVFFDTAGCEYYERTEGDGDEGSRCNENEVTVVKNHVDQLVGAGILPSQIAIITPYQAQVSLLTTLLRPVYGPDLEIGTVDGMQGREKEAIVISLVRSNETREVGFLKDKRRLNVAMTRARRHLCIVGDSSTLQHGGRFLKQWMGWLEGHADVRYAGIE